MGKKKESKGAQLFWLFTFLAIGFMGLLVVTGFFEDGGSGGAEAAPVAEAEPENTAAAEPERPFSGEGYVLSFGPDFDLGMSAVDDLGISVVVAMDQSGSMADPPDTGLQDPKYIQAARAMAGIVDFLESNFSGPAAAGLTLKVGIIGFSDKVNVIFPLTAMDATAFARLRTVLSDPAVFEPTGKTAIGAALEKGAAMLAQSGTIMKSLIVVSDGLNNLEPDPVDAMKAITTNRNDASTVDFPVSTLGTLVSFVGFDIDAGGFTDIEREGARINAAADQASLKAALQRILVADITRLEAAGR